MSEQDIETIMRLARTHGATAVARAAVSTLRWLPSTDSKTRYAIKQIEDAERLIRETEEEERGRQDA